MDNWLDDFAKSRLMKRVVLANYLEHLRLHTENRASQEQYANVEEALEDFAKRTGLTQLEKRALRRQMFVRTALDFSKVKLEDDERQIKTDDAPASILPGVKPGSEKEKAVERKKKRKIVVKDKEEDFLQTTDEYGTEAPVGSEDVGFSNAEATLEPGTTLIVVAEEDDPFAEVKEDKPKVRVTLKKDKKDRKKKAPRLSKERKLMNQIQDIRNVLVSDFMEPGSTWDEPKWKNIGGADPRWKTKNQLTSQLSVLESELIEFRREQERKVKLKEPTDRVQRNNVQFLNMLDKALGLGGRATDDKRREAIRDRSDVGLQSAFNDALEKFRDKIYYRPSQGYDPERGDYVKCMVCDANGKLWINEQNPGQLPVWHLMAHEDELLEGLEPGVGRAGRYREELIRQYLDQYPGASLQSREQELASFAEKLIAKTQDKAPLDAPHISTEAERNLKYTDRVLLDNILYQLRRFGVDPGHMDIEELAREVMHEIKTRLDLEFPGRIASSGGLYGELGSIEDLGIPFEAFIRAFNEEVGEAVHEYRGTIDPQRKFRKKVRWTTEQRKRRHERLQKQLDIEEAEDELALELGRRPSLKEIRERLHKKNLVPVTIGTVGDGSCWNCGQRHVVYVERNRAAINSATCPNCGVAYREYVVTTAGGEEEKGESDTWLCEECGERKYVVIRDSTAKTDPGGPKTYVVYCDERYIGDGEFAEGSSRFVRIVGRAQRETYSPEQEDVTINVGDTVVHDKYGYGVVVWIEGAALCFVEFKEHPEFAKGAELKGEVAYVKTSRTGWGGYGIVTQVIIDEENDSMVVVVNHATGPPSRLEMSYAERGEATVPVSTKVNRNELQKKVARRNDRMRRRARIVQHFAKLGCSGKAIVTVERLPRRTALKERRTRRAKILKALLKRS